MGLLQTLVIMFGVINLTFGGFLYLNSKQNFVVKLYSLIFIFATLWSLSTLLTSIGFLPFNYFKLALDGHYIFGYLAYLSFFWFSLFFPTRQKFSSVMLLSMTFITLVFIALIPFTHLVFQNVVSGQTLASSIQFNTLGYILFILMLSGVFFTGLFILLHTLRKTSHEMLYKDFDRYQIYFAILGNFIAGILGIVFNLIFPLYGNFSFFYINPIFVTAALTVIGLYNVMRYNFLNSRIILSEFFTAVILILSLTRFILSSDGTEKVIDGIILIIISVFSVFLIQSILREKKLREQIEKQEQELEVVNKQQINLLHFMSHEIKGYLTKSQAGFSAIVEGDFGPVTPELQAMANMALADVRKGVGTVMDILRASDLKRGTVSFKSEVFDFKDVVVKTVEGLKPGADEKHLTIEMHIAWELPCKIKGDEEKIRDHVVRNLIDNAIKYTPSGTIKIEVIRKDSIIRFAVEDSGVGITPEDMQRLFTEGGHGKDSVKVNVHSTGYGLYIAKQIVEAHSGKIWAESRGAGTGSRFVVELPAA